jgi:hypothetical protein
MQRYLTAALLLSTVDAGCPFGFGKDSKTAASTKKYPSEVLTCPTGGVLRTPAGFSQANYEAVFASVVEQYETVDSTIKDNYNKRANFAGCLVRFAGHDFMDFRTGAGRGGSDGCIDFSEADNAGLEHCLEEFKIADVFAKHCGTISLADFIVVAGEAVMARTSPTYNAATPFAEGTLAKTFRDNFKYGRETATTCAWNKGYMADASVGCENHEDIFVKHIFNGQEDAWTLTAAIKGAHTLGSAKPQFSGFDGFWSDAENAGIFNNDYYKSLMLKGWAPQLAVNGCPEKNQWQRVDSGKTAHKELMLDADLCLAYHNNKDYAECLKTATAMDCAHLRGMGTRLAATNGHCCANTETNILFDYDVLKAGKPNAFCGQNITEAKQGERSHCCKSEGENSYGDCDEALAPTGPAINAIYSFIQNENTWLKNYGTAWNLATENGHEDLSALET